MEIKLVTWCR